MSPQAFSVKNQKGSHLEVRTYATTREEQTTTYRPKMAYCLFLYVLRAKYGFHMFIWTKISKPEVPFHNTENHMRFKF